MTATVTRVESIDRIEHGPEAWRLAGAVYDRLIDLLEDLDATEWQAETVCEPWTVADMVGHVIGSAEGQASFREQLRTQAKSYLRKGDFGGQPLDAWTALHVEEHAELTPRQRIEALRDLTPRAVRGRARLPRLIGRLPLPLEDGGSIPDGTPDTITLGELYTVILTRDTFLHRIDIARATGRDPRLDAGADRRIVEDVVADWAQRHGRPFELELSGPAGGRYVQGVDGPTIELDPVELCWILSGRGEPDPGRPGADLLRQRILF